MSPVLVSIVLAATDVATDPATPNPDDVTPGIIGFIATFFIAIVTVGLIVDMVRRVRRVNYRAQVREELEAELAEHPAGTPSAPDAPSAPSAGGNAPK
ncbi:hypothetical protein VD659_10565 [Herbiconiux sp. 11R-BC]|uniref:hypothetical protein n=1 Tax=Herbiconiux sp. 11R-BC TaxID=3111637 RepID=UPI003C0E7E37